MKCLFIILLIFLVGCQSTDKEILVFLNKGVEVCNENLYSTTSEYYSRFEAAMQENPSATKPHKQKVDALKIFQNNLFF